MHSGGARGAASILLVIIAVGIAVFAANLYPLRPPAWGEEGGKPVAIGTTATTSQPPPHTCVLVTSLYCELGYPRIIHARPLPSSWAPADAPYYYVVEDNCSTRYVAGYTRGPVLGLEEAVEKALNRLGRGNYSLVEAVYSPGLIVDGRVEKHPCWCLTLAETYKGYRLWPYGCCGDTYVEVDAANGSIVEVEEANYTLPEPPRGLPSPGELASTNISSLVRSTLLEIAGLRGVPEQGDIDRVVREKSYTVDLRIAVLGYGKDALLEPGHVVEKEFIGRPRLYWYIEANVEQERIRVYALVDAATNKLASYLIEQVYPPHQWAGLVVEPVLRAVNTSLDLGEEGGLTGQRLVPVIALVAHPGSRGVFAVKAYWKGYGGYPASLLEKKRAVITLHESGIPGVITVTPLRGKTIVRGGEGVELPVEYSVDWAAGPGMYTVGLHYTVYYPESGRVLDKCLPILILVKG